MSLTKRVRNILHEDGLKEFFSIMRYLKYSTCHTIRNLFSPSTEYSIYNSKEVFTGINEKKLRPVDKYFGELSPSIVPKAKEANINAIVDNVKSNDNVTIIGGGYGLNALYIAEQVGKDGSMKIFEADSNKIELLKKTLDYHSISTEYNIKHGIVGKGYRIMGDGIEGSVIEPEQLQECDVLEMDCEGAELEIIKNMQIRPNLLIIEQHPQLDMSPYSSSDLIPNILKHMGYSVGIFGGSSQSKMVVGHYDPSD